MRTQSSKSTFFALTGLATAFASAPIVAPANPPRMIATGPNQKQADPVIQAVITGHYNNDPKGDQNGYAIGSLGGSIISGSYIVNSTWTVTHFPRIVRAYGTTFNNNTAAGLAVTKATVDVNNGQFDSNGYGLGLVDSHGAIEDGQFSANSHNGLEADASSTVIVDGGTFSGNAGDGIAVSLTSTGTIHGGTVTGNQYGLYAGISSAITVTNGAFAGNTQADLWADSGTITLTGTFRRNGMPLSGTLTDSGSLDVQFPGSSTWQTLTYKTDKGGQIVLTPVTA